MSRLLSVLQKPAHPEVQASCELVRQVAGIAGMMVLGHNGSDGQLDDGGDEESKDKAWWKRRGTVHENVQQEQRKPRPSQGAIPVLPPLAT
jgi:hypothetical protein